MANYRAIANGNWSNLAIWQDDSLGYFANSSVLPTTADDVYANNFTVTIDGTRNASTIRNTAFTPPTNLGAMSIPQMSSNTTPSGTAAASSVQASAAWNAFDRNTGTFWQTLTVNSGWLSYNFPTGKIIKRYGFFTSGTLGRGPRTWTFEGSNNGSTWVVLDTQTNFVTGVSTFFSFDISANTTSYTYYRINITAVQTLGQIIEIAELEMSEVANLYGGIVAGGGFTFANGGNLTCSAPNAIEVGSTTPTLTFSLGSGNSATFNGNVISIPIIAGTFNAISYNSNGTFNIVGDLNLNNSIVSATRRCLLVNGTGVINHIGNIISNQGNANNQNTIQINSNCVYNHTGNSFGGNAGLLANGSTINVTSTFTYNQTGNAVAGSGISIYVVVNCNLNIIGNVSGNGNFPAIFNATNPATIDILGVTTSGSGSAAIQGLVTTFVKVRGNVVNTDTYAAIYAGRIVIDDNVTSWQFKDSTNTITRTLYTAGVALGNPATTNVRNGVTYGPALDLTGTLVVANPSNVLLGVPTDNTTGTYSTTPALIANEIFTKLLSSSDFNTSGSFGKLVKDNLDAQVSTIKTKTDNLPSDPASNTEVNQVASEVVDELNTSSVDVAVRLRNSATVETTGNQIADLS
jgi:hypothetical protein